MCAAANSGGGGGVNLNKRSNNWARKNTHALWRIFSSGSREREKLVVVGCVRMESAERVSAHKAAPIFSDDNVYARINHWNNAVTCPISLNPLLYSCADKLHTFKCCCARSLSLSLPLSFELPFFRQIARKHDSHSTSLRSLPPSASKLIIFHLNFSRLDSTNISIKLWPTR
jgi:hypothetical protein